MVKKLLLCLILFSLSLQAQKKSSFDIQEEKILKKSSTGPEIFFSDNEFEATMLSGGYFTIGTNFGKSQQNLDNKCQVTYGHPYALTSHPLISVDGNWYKPDDYFSLLSQVVESNNNDTLRYSCSNDQLSFEFLMINSSSGNIRFVQTIKNLDTKEHMLSAGLVVDPALGKWGDGYLYINNHLIVKDTIINNSPVQLSLWEKSSGAKGIGVELTSAGNYKVLAANWNEYHKTNAPVLTDINLLYDLLIKLYFIETQIPAGGESTNVVELKLIDPDFSADVFTRWNIPFYLDMNQGEMFPREFDTHVELTNLVGSSIIYSVQPELSSNLNANLQQYETQISNHGTFQKIHLKSSIAYEDKIVEAVLKIKNGSVLVDEIRRNVFIPETPVSDTGLTIAIDTLITSAFPKVEFTFGVVNNTTGYPIAVSEENVFLYENNSRIFNYSFSPDTSHGINAADIVFVLDVTGSMGGTIDKVKNNIIEFADSLDSRGIDYRLGLVTFLDEIENVYDFTKNVVEFQNHISQQYAHGGGDGPENSLEALKRASQFPYRLNCKRTIVWITDIDYHENDWATQLTKNEVIDLLLSNDITVHAIGNEGYKSYAYDPIIIPSKGNYYDINGNFRDILLDISRMRTSGKYIISYHSASGSAANTIKLEIRHNGRGGNIEFQYNKNGQSLSNKPVLSYYPNPFNPEITFIINNTNYIKGEMLIFNILGECVKTYSINNAGLSRVAWNAKNESGLPVSTGFYIVNLKLTNSRNEVFSETAKILYVK